MVLFCSSEEAESALAPFVSLASVKVVRAPCFDASRSSRRLAESLVWGLDSSVLSLFEKHDVQLAFESATFLGWRCNIPVIAWLPDFQHRRLRDQFGLTAYWRRDIGYRAQVSFGRELMLSSQDAQRDCERYYPKAHGRTHVVHFSTNVPPSLIDDDPMLSLQSYGLPKSFYYLPNQFWAHKNHGLVVEATAIARSRGHVVNIVATGNPVEPRSPGYFQTLEKRISDLCLADNFRILGLLSRRDVVSLLRVCKCLINPSLFEGWSSTVEEARAFGVPMVLSDIPVHREQMADAATYFDPQDSADLADKLMLLDNALELPEGPRSIAAGSDERSARFADDFVRLAEQAMYG